jgi:hypothetical protein
VFLVDNADDLIDALRQENYSYRIQQYGFRNSVEFDAELEFHWVH